MFLSALFHVVGYCKLLLCLVVQINDTSHSGEMDQDRYHCNRWYVPFLIITNCPHLLLFLAKRQAWGWFAFGGLVFLAILSLPPIRRSSYTLFWHAHWIGFFMFTVAVSTFLHAYTCIISDVPVLFFSPAIMRLLASLTASLDSPSTVWIRSLV